MNKTINMMIEKANNALLNSYSPYSNFKVACCIHTDNNFFTGVNIENSSYSVSLCAEMAAIGQMVSAGCQRIQNIVILASSNELCPPCGACRQCIFEFSTIDTSIHLCNKHEILQSYTIKELLPLAFSFHPTSGPHDE